jgi:TrmH family RNA methyltransferase
VQRWAKLQRDGRLRRRERRLVVEGPHLIAAAVRAGLKPVALLTTEEALARPEIARLVGRAQPILVSAGVFASIVDSETPQGIAAELEIPILERLGTTVFLEGVQDPGNVGAIVRSAAAFNAGTVVLDRQCADPWSPKVVRAGMGGHFLLGIRQVDDLPAQVARFQGRVLCAAARGGTALREVVLSGEVAWIFGAEGAGVSPALEALAAERVFIPMAHGTESLNVAAAAAICLYEAFSRPASRS